MNNKYEYMLNMPHYEPRNHKRMPLIDRASQFAPFAALTGFEEAINEVLRVVDNKIELTDEKKEEISFKIKHVLKNNENAKITYFIKDSLKNGGQYKTLVDKIIKMDEIKKELILNDGTRIELDDILDINSASLNY